MSYYLKTALESLTDEDIAMTVERLKDSKIYETETANGLISNLRFNLVAADEDYFYSYEDKMSEVKVDSVKAMVEKYIDGVNPLVLVYVNPDVYEQQKEAFESEGFVFVSKDNSSAPLFG